MPKRRRRKLPSWKTMRGFRKRREAKTHIEEDLEGKAWRRDQKFRVHKGSDPTYPYEVQVRKKSIRERLKIK